MKQFFVLLVFATILLAGCVNQPTAPYASSSGSNVSVSGNGTNSVSSSSSGAGYSGEVLAGTSAKLYDFKKADYENALNSNKLIVLYFFANWCPECREEFPKMQTAFNELTTDRVVAFRVNFNDDQTDADETALAQEFGVSYQHTKVFVKNKQRVLKSPESWEKARYLSEINGALAVG